MSQKGRTFPGRPPLPLIDRSEGQGPMLSVSNLEVVYNDVVLVLRGISLEVPPGKIVALLGANGAGKTTTMRAVTGLARCPRRRHHQRPDQSSTATTSPTRDPSHIVAQWDQPGDGGSPDLCRDVGRREPAGRRLRQHQSRKQSMRPSTRVMTLFPLLSPTGASRSPDTCRVASSRCSPSAAP